MRGFRYRDRRKKASACQILPEDESLSVSKISDRFLGIWDFLLFIHEDGQVDYFDQKAPGLAFSDHGNSLHIFQEENLDVLEATLWLGIEKWGRVQVKGDEDFQRRVWDRVLRLHAEKRVIIDPRLAATLPQAPPDPALVRRSPQPATLAVPPVVKEQESLKPKKAPYSAPAFRPR